MPRVLARRKSLTTSFKSPAGRGFFGKQEGHSITFAPKASKTVSSLVSRVAEKELDSIPNLEKVTAEELAQNVPTSPKAVFCLVTEIADGHDGAY